MFYKDSGVQIDDPKVPRYQKRYKLNDFLKKLRKFIYYDYFILKDIMRVSWVSWFYGIGSVIQRLMVPHPDSDTLLGPSQKFVMHSYGFYLHRNS